MKTTLTFKIVIILFILSESNLSEVNTALIERVRKFFAAVPQQSREYSAQDLKRVQTDNEWLEGFAAGAKSAGQVVKRLMVLLMFRNIAGVSYLIEQSFPREIYEIGFVVPVGKDREGRHILLTRLNRMRKSGKLTELTKKFFIYQFEKIDLIKPYPGILHIADYSGLDMANADTDLFAFMMTTVEQYTRGKLLQLNVNAPDSFIQVKDVLKLGAADSVVNTNIFIKSEELTKYVDPSVLPKYLGGNNDKPLNIIPDSQLNKMLDSFGFSDKDIQQIKSQFATLLD